jgi:hypothetical protein
MVGALGLGEYQAAKSRSVKSGQVLNVVVIAVWLALLAGSARAG